jgi:hypothetical protein
MTSSTFGSDALPLVSFVGIAAQEICLSFMMTSIDHPLIFVILVLADVLENCFCLYSLHRTVSSARSSKIVPLENGSETSSENAVISTHDQNVLKKRTSSVYKLIQDLDVKSTDERKGTALFISAVLLQREMVEMIIPIQALGVFSILYIVDVKSNSLVSKWSSSEEYHQVLMYTSIDLVVEMFVFISTIFVLHRIFPKLDPWRILKGLLRMHSTHMAILMFVSWIGNLLIQSTYSGVDPSFHFKWLECEGEANATWHGGFDWGC